MKNEVDSNRRHFLTVATSVTGGLGIAMAVVPFLSSLKPSARAGSWYAGRSSIGITRAG